MNPGSAPESLIRSIDSGLPHEAGLLDAVVNRKPDRRLYSRVIDRCGRCHNCCPGTQFCAAVCSQTGKEVLEFAAPPLSCPLPLT